jgi:3-dehydrosphinganine reductase
VRIISEATAFNENAPPDIVWCCAGSSYPTLFIDTPVAEIKNQVDSNYLTSAYMAHATLRAWLKAPSKTPPATARSGPLLPRHLIFTASFLSFFTLAGFAPYSPTKAALRSLSDTLSQEMNLYASSSSPNKPEVRIHTIFPATIYTESYEAENRVKSDVTKKLEEGDAGQTPDEVAKRSIAGLERGDELVTTTFLTRLVMTSTLGGSIRNGWAVLDTVLSWVMSLVMVFVRWDMDVKVRRWGRENGESGMKRAPRQ